MPRPFRGLRNDPGPREHYDVVVIGAGIAGLVAGNMLARQGASVLLVERHWMVGGYCSTFQRKRYVFDASSHFYPLLGNPDTITGKLMKQLDIRTEWVRMDPVDTFHFPDGSVFDVPGDYETYRRLLDEEFPHQRSEIEAFFRDVEFCYRYGLLHYFRDVNTPQLKPFLDRSLRDLLDQHFTDAKLKLLLTADCPHWGAPPNETSFVFDSLLRLSYFLGNYYPVGGSQALSDDMARAFEAAGGDLLMKSDVQRILVQDGAVRGVDIETGPQRERRVVRVTAGAIVSAGDMRHTLEDLIGAEHVPPAHLEWVRSLVPSYPCYLLHLGVDGPTTEQLTAAQGYYWRDWDSDGLATDTFNCKIFVPTLYEPTMAPPGKHVVVVQKAHRLDYDHIEDWPAHKEAFEEFLLDNVEKALPGFRDTIVVRSGASARTAWRFTGNQRGSMLGWKMCPEQLGEKRPDIVGPLENLYFTGHWTRPGGGITPVIISAQRVAERLAARG